jgi:hypothetical protein
VSVSAYNVRLCILCLCLCIMMCVCVWRLLLRYRKRGYTAKGASDAEMQMLFEPSENHVDTDYSSAYAGLL